MKSNRADYVASYLKPSSCGAGHYELTEPHLLYLDKQQSVSYLQSMENAKYSGGFHADLRNIMSANADKIIQNWPGLTLIDLGPGYPDKTLPLMEAAFKAGKKLSYIPVDISQNYLDIASQAARPYADTIYPVCALFHLAKEQIAKFSSEQNEKSQKMAFIGLTFMNFSPENILPVLKDITDKSGVSAIASELITDANTVECVLAQYDTPEVAEFAFGPIKHLGIVQQECTSTLNFNHQKSRIELGYNINKQMIAGHEVSHITTAVSYRYTKPLLEKVLQENFSKLDMYESQNGNTVLALGVS